MTRRVLHRPGRTSSQFPDPSEHRIEPPPPRPVGAREGAGSIAWVVPVVGATAALVVMAAGRDTMALWAATATIAGTLALWAVVSLTPTARATRAADAQRQHYLAYLNHQRCALDALDVQALEQARQASPEAAALLSVARDPQRVWDHRRDDTDFLHLRLGTGPVPLHRVAASAPPAPAYSRDDLLECEFTRLRERFAATPGAPARIDLDSAGPVSIIGDRRFVLRTAQILVSQAAASSSTEDLELALVAPPERIGEWDWLQWLPHLADPQRATALPLPRATPTVAHLQDLLAGEFTRRLSLVARAGTSTAGGDRALSFPRLLVVIDAAAEDTGSLRAPGAGADLADLGVTVLRLSSSARHECTATRLRIVQDAPSTPGLAIFARIERSGPGPGMTPVARVRLDTFGPAGATAVAMMLASFELAPGSHEHPADRHLGAAGPFPAQSPSQPQPPRSPAALRRGPVSAPRGVALPSRPPAKVLESPRYTDRLAPVPCAEPVGSGSRACRSARQLHPTPGRS